MDVGGFCAEGGPYAIRQHCSQGVPAVMVGSILGGIVLALLYVGVTLKNGIQSFAALLWPALFLGSFEPLEPYPAFPTAAGAQPAAVAVHA